MSLSRQGVDQLPDIWHTDACDHVVIGASEEGSVASRLDVSEAGGAHQWINEWIEKWQRRLPGHRSGLIDQSAESSPNRRTPTRSANLGCLSIKHQKSTLIGIGRQTYIWNQSVVTCGHSVSCLPRWTLEENASTATAACPTCLTRHAAVCCKGQTRATYSDHEGIG